MNALLSIIAAEQQSGGSFIIFIPLIALMGYLLIVSPRKQKKKQAEMMSSLKVGDEVTTTSGIYGTISYLEDNIAHLVVDTDVVIRVSKTSVNRLGGAAASSDEVIDLDEVAGETDAGGDDAPSSKSKKS